jgi:polyisoprenoid-binding protein YceI
MKKISFVAVAVFFIGSSFMHLNDIKTAKVDKSKSTIGYHMVHPMHSWDGVSKDVDGMIQFDDQTHLITKVAILAKVSSFDSKNSNRDSHMMEVTEAIKYPTVSFVSSSIKDNGAAVEVTGTISFHGVSKQISFTANEVSATNRKTVSGQFVLLLEDFKIERPSMMMMKTENEMKLNFSVEFPFN